MQVVVSPICGHCGGELLDLKDHIVYRSSSDLPDSFKNEIYSFTGTQCVDCENRVGSYVLCHSSIELSEKATLTFQRIQNNLFKPLVIKDGFSISIPLLVGPTEIELIIKKLYKINFSNHPFNYIKMIVAGCVSFTLKHPVN